MCTAVTLRFRSSDGHHAHYDAVIDRQLVERALVIQCATNRATFSCVAQLPVPTQRQILKTLLASDRVERRLVHARFMQTGTATDAQVGREVLTTSIHRSRSMVRANLDILQASPLMWR